MKISQFATRVGVSDHTIRYYERIGVLKPIKRDTSGYREFGEADILWMEFVLRLKNTGMPIEGIIEYARLRDQGDSTKQARVRILEAHEKKVAEEIAEKKLHLKKIQEKIETYKSS